MTEPGDSSDAIFDVSHATWDSAVIERSRELPVIVDFWAPWCGPCRFLGPVLEGLIEGEFAGRLVLAKINTDEEVELATEYRISGIPAVKIFRDGEIVSEFTGNLPEDQLREVLQSTLPSKADMLAAEALEFEAAGNLLGAEASANAAVELDPRQPRALLILGRLLEARDEQDDAIQAYRRIPAGTPEFDESAQRLAALDLVRSAAGDDGAGPDQLRARVQEDDGDLDARFRLGLALAAQGEHREALEQLLGVIQRDRKFGDEEPRKAMLKVFEVVGTRSELADEFRAKLARTLY